MSEIRYRANLLSSTVDRIEITYEDAMYVDVQYDRGYGVHSDRSVSSRVIRREAKVTAYSRICKTKEQAQQAIHEYALEQLVLAQQAVRRWSEAVKQFEEKPVAEPTD